MLPVASSSVRTVGGIKVTWIHDTIHINCHIDRHIQVVWLVVIHNNSIALALQIIECYHYRLKRNIFDDILTWLWVPNIRLKRLHYMTNDNWAELIGIITYTPVPITLIKLWLPYRTYRNNNTKTKWLHLYYNFCKNLKQHTYIIRVEFYKSGSLWHIRWHLIRHIVVSSYILGDSLR